MFKRALQLVMPPPVFDFWAAALGTTASASRILARVVHRTVESSDAVTLVLRPNGRFRGYTAGQHVNVVVEVDGRRFTRSYSPTAPWSKGLLSITVKRVPGGKVSGHLCDRTAVGSVLEIGDAFGEMSLDACEEGAALFLAAGSGITPLVAMIREAKERGFSRPITLLYWSRTAAEQCFADALSQMAAVEPRLTVKLFRTREGDQRLDRALLDRHVEKGALGTVYACGPEGFVATASALLKDRAKRFVAEAFSAPAVELGAEAAIVRVSLAKSGRVLDVSSGQTLLAALDAAGVNPRSGCRIGICNTCSCRKVSGQTIDQKSGEIQGEPNAPVRICVSRPLGDVTLDL